MVQSAARPFLPGLWLTRAPKTSKLPTFIAPRVGDKLERRFAVCKTPTARQAHPKPVTAIIQKGYLAVGVNRARHLNSGLCRVFEAVPQGHSPRVCCSPCLLNLIRLFIGILQAVPAGHGLYRPSSAAEAAGEYTLLSGLPQIRGYVFDRAQAKHTHGVLGVQITISAEDIQRFLGRLRAGQPGQNPCFDLAVIGIRQALWAVDG